MAASGKKVCTRSIEESPVTLNRHLMYVLPQKIQKRRREILMTNSTKIGLNIADVFSDRVTHVVAECDNYDQILHFLNAEVTGINANTRVVRTSWLSDCLKAGKIIPIEERHSIERIEKETKSATEESRTDTFPVYECQRATPLHHQNEHITHALEVLAKDSDLRNDDVSRCRALAFRRAACVFKSLPSRVKSAEEIKNHHSIGSHVRGVVEDILDNGFSSEAEHIENSIWFKAMTTFTTIFGVGPTTAEKWYRLGLKTIDDLKKEESLPNKDERISVGLTYYDDLVLPVLRCEAEVLMEIIKRELDLICPGCQLVLTGGFRRGKDSGHDIDFLLTHPEEGQEEGVLAKLIEHLDRTGLVIYGRKEQNSYSNTMLQSENSRNTFDHFEKWIGILRIHKKHRIDTYPCEKDTKEKCKDSNMASSQVENNINRNRLSSHPGKRKTMEMLQDEVLDEGRHWYARRVDIVVTPISQFYYALVGWTGSKHFNRSLRLYAQRELGLKLTSHALYDPVKKCLVPASSEREVFENLSLPYFEPTERNC